MDRLFPGETFLLHRRGKKLPRLPGPALLWIRARLSRIDGRCVCSFIRRVHPEARERQDVVPSGCLTAPTERGRGTVSFERRCACFK